MYTDVTINAEDFTTIHNTLWELEYRGLDGAAGAERIRAALQGAYAQDNSAFDRKHDHYHEVQQQLGLNSIWSVYEVNDLSAPHPYQGAQYVIYDQHWGESGEVVKAITGLTWAALYVAADAAIRDSGDQHHCFIEGFEPVADKPHHLRLTTGS